MNEIVDTIRVAESELESESPGVGGFGWSRSQSRNLKQLWSRSRKKIPDSEKNIKI